MKIWRFTRVLSLILVLAMLIQSKRKTSPRLE